MKAFANFSLKKLLSEKRFTVPFSVILAFAIWLTITINQKPTMERSISDATVSINLENTFAAENGMSIIGDISEQKFTVSLRGPSYAISTLTAADLSLYASAAEVDAPGEYSLKVALSKAADDTFEVLNITPQTLKVTFDYIETKEFTVIALAEGATAAEGLIAEAGVVGGAEKDTVSISGPRTVINKIEKVVALASVNKTLNVSETFDADIMLYDDANNVIEPLNLTISETKFKVTVPISKQKTVPVKVEFSNVPQGFNKDLLKIAVDHPTVTVIGTPETVDKTTQISLSAIDLTTVSPTSASFDVSPKLPEGVRLLDAIDHFTVSIDMSRFAEKIITVSSIKYKDVGAGLSAGDGTPVKNVRICGPKTVISKLDATKIYAEAVLTDKKAGAHTVNVSIGFNGYDSLWAIGAYQTTVTIK